MAELTRTYEPNPAVAYLYRRFFQHIQVDDAWVRTVRVAAAHGHVVYVLRNVSFVDFLALDHLTKRLNLPQIRFAPDMGLSLLDPLGRGLLAAFVRSKSTVEERLQDALDRGGSAALFLKHSPSLLDDPGAHGARGQSEGDEAMRALFRIQRRTDRPILLVPQTFVWSKRPDQRGGSVVDRVFGPREWPGRFRAAAQFFANYQNVDFRAGDALDLREIVADDDDDDARLRRVTYTMLTRLERERRAILGPAKKAPDRVREEVLRSGRLQQAIKDLAGDDRASRAVLTAKAYGMLRELEANPEPEAHKAFEIAMDVIANRIYAGISVDDAGLEAVREASKRGTVVLLPSHKSHVDYVMLSYVLRHASIQLPLIAAGDNLAFFPMGFVFRRGGAFFIRRSFKGDRLYAAVVDAYLRRLVRDGWAIEFFLEGGRSRTGKLLPPKFGLLSMIVDAALANHDKPVTFVPVSIGYDRVVEERSYVRELSGGEKRKEDAGAMLRGTKVLRGFYGGVNVQIGEPLTIPGVARTLGIDPNATLSPAQRRAIVMRLGYRTMAEINRVTSVTPGAIVALVLLGELRRGVPHLELVGQVRKLVATLSRRRARVLSSLVNASGQLRVDAVREAALLFVRGELVQQHVPGEHLEGKQRARAAIYTGDDVVYTVPDERRLSLSLSKNTLVHFFVDHALVATAFLRRSEARTVGAIREDVRALSRLFKLEFAFRADATFDTIYLETLRSMIEEGELVASDPSLGDASELRTGPGHDDRAGDGWLGFYADVLAPFLESYRIAARAATLLLKGPMTQKDLAKRALAIGDRMFLSGEIARRDAIARSVIENGIEALRESRYLVLSEGKLELAPSFASVETAATIETRIRAFGERRGGRREGDR